MSKVIKPVGNDSISEKPPYILHYMIGSSHPIISSLHSIEYHYKADHGIIGSTIIGTLNNPPYHFPRYFLCILLSHPCMTRVSSIFLSQLTLCYSWGTTLDSYIAIFSNLLGVYSNIPANGACKCWHC